MIKGGRSRSKASKRPRAVVRASLSGGPRTSQKAAPASPAVSERRPLPELLSTAQVARIFGRSERTIRNWIRAGHLRPVRVGRAVFFRADDIHALLDAR